MYCAVPCKFFFKYRIVSYCIASKKNFSNVLYCTLILGIWNYCIVLYLYFFLEPKYWSWLYGFKSNRIGIELYCTVHACPQAPMSDHDSLKLASLLIEGLWNLCASSTHSFMSISGMKSLTLSRSIRGPLYVVSTDRWSATPLSSQRVISLVGSTIL